MAARVSWATPPSWPLVPKPHQWCSSLGLDGDLLRLDPTATCRTRPRLGRTPISCSPRSSSAPERRHTTQRQTLGESFLPRLARSVLWSGPGHRWSEPRSSPPISHRSLTRSTRSTSSSRSGFREPGSQSRPRCGRGPLGLSGRRSSPRRSRRPLHWQAARSGFPVRRTQARRAAHRPTVVGGSTRRHPRGRLVVV